MAMSEGTTDQKARRQAEEEALFQSLLKRLPSISDKKQLLEVGLLALQLMLRRPNDKPLLSELMGEVRQAIGAIPDNSGEDTQKRAIRQAATKTIEILKAAKQRRKSRASEQKDAKPHATHHDHHDHHAAHHHHGHAKHSDHHHNAKLEWWEQGWTWATVAASVVAIAGIGYAVIAYREDSGPPGSDLAQQMFVAADGRIPANHIFGGRLTAESRDGDVMIVAERVPPTKCVSAAWELSKKGLISINGFGLQRVTASRISELCHADAAGSTIAWTRSTR